MVTYITKGRVTLALRGLTASNRSTGVPFREISVNVELLIASLVFFVIGAIVCSP